MKFSSFLSANDEENENGRNYPSAYIMHLHSFKKNKHFITSIQNQAANFQRESIAEDVQTDEEQGGLKTNMELKMKKYIESKNMLPFMTLKKI